MDKQRKGRFGLKLGENRYHFKNIGLYKILSKIDEIPNLEIYQKDELLSYITKTFIGTEQTWLQNKKIDGVTGDEVSDFIEDNPDLDEDQYEELHNIITVEKVTDTILNYLNDGFEIDFKHISEHCSNNTNFKGYCKFIELDENFKPLEEITKDEDIKQSFTGSPEKILSIIEKILQDVLMDFKNKDYESFKQYPFIKNTLDYYIKYSHIDHLGRVPNYLDKNSIKLIRGLTSINALNLDLSPGEYRIAFKKKANIFRAIEIIRATIGKDYDEDTYPKMTRELFLKIVSTLDSKESEGNKNKNSVKTKKNDKEVTF